jgi:two-component system NtrC family sensor kinase
VLWVSDTGCGISPENQQRIFEPYFTTKPLGVGTGVWLAVSAGMVEAHGGSLAVDCPAAGGTVFTITLPFRSVEPESKLREPTERVSGRQRRILVIDDEDDVREVLSEILSNAGHRVDLAVSGRAALAQLEAVRYDVILCDVRMPDMDGLALFDEIRRQWPQCARRVVFVSGDTLSSGLSEFAAAGQLRILEKPFVPREVRRLVAQVLNESSHAALD